MSDDRRSDAGSPHGGGPAADRPEDRPPPSPEPSSRAPGEPGGGDRSFPVAGDDAPGTFVGGSASSGEHPAADPAGGSAPSPDGHASGSVPPAEGTSGPEGGDPAEPAEDPAGRSRSSKGSFWRELPVLLVVAFLLAFLLRTFVLQVFYIPSSSMEPTLQVNDRMVVEKITYLFREPERGEIVVFEGETLGEPDPDANLAERAVRGFGQFVGLVPASARDFVKRVIGLPGDEVSLEDGQVYINGEPIDEPYARLDASDFGPVTVPEDSLFFLGDNRANSSDSRRSLGFVPMDHVVGRSALILWPVDHGGMLTGVEYDVPDPAGQDTDAPTDGDADSEVDDEVDDAA